MAIGQLVLEKKIFKDVYYIWAWWQYWSCDLDGLNIFLFLPTLKATCEIWLQSAYWLLRKCLKSSNYGLYKKLQKNQSSITWKLRKGEQSLLYPTRHPIIPFQTVLAEITEDKFRNEIIV